MSKGITMKAIALAFFFAIAGITVQAQTSLSSGDMALLGMDTPGEDFAFVCFIDIAASTEIYFTDEEGDGDYTIGTGEGTVLFTAPAGGITAGTVITYKGNASYFSITSDGNMTLGNSGDGIIAYQGSAVSSVTTFLHAIGENSSRIGTFPSGFTNYITFGADDGQYNGTRSGTAADLLTEINNSSNWTTSGSGVLPFTTTSFTISVGASVDDPGSFTATASSTTQIDLTASANGNGDNILVAYNTSASFGTPTDGSSYTAGSSITGGGTVHYVGSAATLTNHTSLSSGTTYYYKAWSVDGSDVYSSGLTADATTLSPAITLSVSTLTGFSYLEGSGPSTEQSFTVEGSNLTANISLTPPTNYEISTGTGGSFSATNPITLTQSGGTVNSTTIYVRLKSGLSSGSYNGEDITATSSGASAQNLTCDGAVTGTQSLPYSEAFASSSWPSDWSYDDFTINNSNNAGGTAHEARLAYFSAIANASHITTPPINTSSESTLTLSWNQKTDYYEGGSGSDYVVKVQTSTDGSSFTDVWSQTVTADETAAKQTSLSAADGVGSSTLYIRWLYYSNTTNRFSYWYIDDISLSASSAPDDPQSFTATTSSESQIDLTATANAAGDDILVAYNTSSTFGTPTDGLAYTNGNSITGGGTVLYTGSAASLSNHTSLNSGTTYYYKVWSYNGSTNYSLGATANATTLSAEPTNHASGFAVTGASTSDEEIVLTWNDNDGTQAAAGFLVKASTVSYADITDPTDGSEEADATLVKNVAHGTQNVTFTGLTASTTYYFQIYPYTNSGSDIDYKTDGSVPQVSETTTAAVAGPSPGDVIFNEIDESGDPNYVFEAIELLVVNGPVDMSGWIITEESENNTITFSSSKGTFSNVPEGTYIAVYVRSGTGITEDVDASDGNMVVKVDGSYVSGAIYISGSELFYLSSGTLSSSTAIDAVNMGETVSDNYGLTIPDVGSGFDGYFENGDNFDNDNASNWHSYGAEARSFGSSNTAQDDSSLPIDLLSFTASQDNETIVLKWITASETNNDYFTVERSLNGSEFSPIGQLQGAGNSFVETHYSYNDAKSGSKVRYYRLRQTDFNGQTSYSSTLVVHPGEAKPEISSMTMQNGILNIQMQHIREGEFELYDIQGKLMHQQSFDQPYVNLSYTILPKGIYIVHIRNSETVISQKIRI